MPNRGTNDNNNVFQGDLCAEPRETIAAVETLEAWVGTKVLDVTVPLAAADTYAITLPPVASCPGSRLVAIAARATGVYVDGEVTIQDQDDAATADYASDALTAAADVLVIENFGGVMWVEHHNVTT